MQSLLSAYGDGRGECGVNMETRILILRGPMVLTAAQ